MPKVQFQRTRIALQKNMTRLAGRMARGASKTKSFLGMTSDPVSLCWIAATQSQDYLNLGDALSPVIVAALTGRPVRHAALTSSHKRMSAIGTIGQALIDGEVDVWGTGCSCFANPLAMPAQRRPYVVPGNTKLRVHATRGPIAWRLMTGANPDRSSVFGDPGWLMPRFYRPSLNKTAELGVILHLSELEDRALEVHPKSHLTRYQVPPHLQGKIRLINTVTPISAEGLRQKMDEILSCRRIISTSLHGLVFAETYGIPNMYWQERRGAPGVQRIMIGEDDGMNLRMSDFYAGLGQKIIAIYNQPRGQETDWDAVIAALDRAWYQKELDADRLVEALPLPLSPIVTDNIFAHPLITELPFQHVPAK